MWAIVVAAGRGERFGAPKQFAELGAMRVVDRAVAAARRSCDAVVLVLAAGVQWSGPPVDAVVTGGDTRSASVRSGLAAVPADVEIVVVHDAARPLATDALFTGVIGAVRAGADAAVPAVPVVDTVKRVAGSRVSSTIARDDLVVVQTPQAFVAARLRDAHAGSPDAPDDAAVVEEAGGVVEVIAGDRRNLKVTTPDDLVCARAWLEEGVLG